MVELDTLLRDLDEVDIVDLIDLGLDSGEGARTAIPLSNEGDTLSLVS